MYLKTKSVGTKIYWKCQEACGAKLTTLADSNMVYKMKGEHSHPADVGKVLVKEATADITNQMKLSQRPYPAIYKEVVNKISTQESTKESKSEFASQMPSMDIMCN